MPTQLWAKGKITKSGNKKFEKNHELITYIDGQFCYMGNFKTAKRTPVTVRDFKELPEAVSPRSLALISDMDQ